VRVNDMPERAGCTSGKRGYGSRKFNGVIYNVFKVYVAKQTNHFSCEEQDKLNYENKALMEYDRWCLKREGYKTRVLHEDLGQVHILYVKEGEENE
jgi:hypothetical protein